MRLNRRINITIKSKGYVYQDTSLPVYFQQNSEGVHVYWRGTWNNISDDFGITAGSLHLEEILCDSEFSLNQLCSTKFEVQCFNLNFDLAGCEIIVTYTDTTTDIEYPLFVGIVDSSTTDNFNDFRDIIAYDKLYTLREYNVGEWWDAFWADRPQHTVVAIPVGSPINNEYYELINGEYFLSTDTSVVSGKTYYYNTPIATIGELRTALCTEVGLGCESVALVNDDIQVKKYLASTSTNVTTQVKFGDLMSMICEINGVIGHIDRDGLFRFVSLSTTQKTIGAYDKTSVNFEDYETQLITGINVYESSQNLMLAY